MAGLLLLSLFALALIAVPVSLLRLQQRLAALTARVADLESRLARLNAGAVVRDTEPRVTAPPPPPAMAPRTPVPVAPAIARPTPAPPPASVPPVAPQPSPEPRAESPAPNAGWEVVVGASWLNKIGVLVLVLGLGFLLAYSFTHLGAGGRVLLGFGVSASLLAAGVVLARTDDHRVYGQGLIAGGWAGIYLTAFAMHGIPASRIVESDLVASTALLAVASGMIVHALRFQSMPMTSLSYVIAYATLAMSPLSGFSMAAAIPLTASLLVISVRAGWPALSMLGLAATYGLFAIREQAFPEAALDPSGAPRYLAIGVFWALFEVADLANRSRRSGLSLVNTVGFLGVSLLQMPDNPAVLGRFIGGAAVAALVSAAARFVWPDHEPTTTTGDARATVRFTSAHVSVAVASALFVWASLVMFETPSRATLASLLNAELLVLAGLSLGDVALRRIGLAIAAVTGWLALAMIGSAAMPGATLSAVVPARLVAALVVAAWYTNDLWIRRTGVMHALERGYSWSAFLIVLAVLAEGLPQAYLGPAFLTVASLLFERSRRVPEDFRGQAGVAAMMGPATLFASSGLAAFESTRVLWTVFPASIALCGWLAWRIGSTSAIDAGPRRQAIRVMTMLALAVVALFEWHVCPAEAVGAAWAATALAIGMAAARQPRVPGFQEGAAVLLLLGALGTLAAISQPGSRGWPDVAYSVVVIVILVGTAAKKSLRATGAHDETDTAVGVIAAAAATLLLGLLTFDEVRAGLITTAWGVEGLALLSMGFLLGSKPLRLSGLAMLLACLVKLFGYDLSELEPVARILSFVALGLVLLAVSWFYTRSARQV